MWDLINLALENSKRGLLQVADMCIEGNNVLGKIFAEIMDRNIHGVNTWVFFTYIKALMS